MRYIVTSNGEKRRMTNCGLAGKRLVRDRMGWYQTIHSTIGTLDMTRGVMEPEHLTDFIEEFWLLTSRGVRL